MKDKNKRRIIEGRWKKILIHQRKITFQLNIQSLGKGLTLGRSTILKKEIEWLPFKFNLGDAPFTKEQQDQLLNLIYDNQ